MIDDNSVSVIIPTHNHGQYLAEAIKSVLNQTILPLEIYVVDDGSTDDTKFVASQFPQVHYIFQLHKGNQTPARAINAALPLAKGRFIVVLGADDILASCYLEKCLAEFNRPDVGIVFTGCQEFEASTKLRIPRKFHHRLSVFCEPQRQLGSMMVRRQVYFGAQPEDCANLFEPTEFSNTYLIFLEYASTMPEGVGGYDETLEGLEDRDLFIRAGLTGWKIRSIPQALHYARVDDGKVTAHADIHDLWQKYPLMKSYAFASRCFDAGISFLRSPSIFIKRLYNKGVRLLFPKLSVLPEKETKSTLKFLVNDDLWIDAEKLQVAK